MSAGPGAHNWLPGRTALYRLYDTGGALLYIGIAANPERRFDGHESTKSWWPHVDRNLTKIEWYDTRTDAEAAEDEAIRTEHALHNVARSPWAPKPRELGRDEATVAELRANLTEVVNRVRLLGTLIVIVNRDRARTPQAAVVPVDLVDLIEEVGGLSAAREVLRKHAETAG